MRAASPLDGRRAVFFHENLIKIGIISIAALGGNFLNWSRGRFKKIHSPLDFKLVYVFKRRNAEFLFEYADDIIFAVMKMEANFGKRGNGRYIFINKP